MAEKFKFFGYYDREPVVGEKLSQEPCELFEIDVLPPPSRKEQCLRGFAVGEITKGGSKLGAISEKDFITCKDVEDFETLLDTSEDMGDCVRAYNQFKLQQFKHNEELLKQRERYQADMKQRYAEFEEWQKKQQEQQKKVHTNSSPTKSGKDADD